MSAYPTTTIHPNFTRRPTKRIFTFEHAIRALPLVSRITSDIVEQHRQVCDLEDVCQVADPSRPLEDEIRIREAYADALDRLRELIDELADVGCELRDWRRGIVDFPAIHNGRNIEYCWRLGETEIDHWHAPDAGFCGRRKIGELFKPNES